jgi:thiamine-phosphate pyrophosphorylase
MAESCVLYYITDRKAFPGDEPARRRRLLDKIAEASSAHVDYIQLREKDLTTRDLESLANEAMRIIGQERKLAADHCPLTTALLINSRADVARATNAAGVHLPANNLSPEEVRAVWQSACGAGTPFDKLRAGSARISPRSPAVSVSCHSPEEVAQAAASQATLALFAPVFEKKDAPAVQPSGLEKLRQACREKIPVLALGGVTLQNARSCLQAGAAGIAAIRLFQENDIATIVRILRA